jgi:hypothetical protein
MNLTGENRSTRRKTCPNATLSTTNPTWIDPGSNPDLRGERPATNRLSHGTASIVMLSHSLLHTDHFYAVFLTRNSVFCDSSEEILCRLRSTHFFP